MGKLFLITKGINSEMQLVKNLEPRHKKMCRKFQE